MTEKDLENYYMELLELAHRAMPDDAEDLASEVVLSALADIRAGKQIENPSGYLKTLLSRRKNDILRRKYRDSCVVWDDGSLLSLVPDKKSRAFDEAEYSRVRRELSRLNLIYREVLVRFYMRGESIDSIASALGIPVGTVKRRLSSGRERLRERLVMQKNSELSYSPKNLSVSIFGEENRNGEPFSLVNNSLLAQNILVAAYEKPLGVSEIADSLGVPAPYVESELERLTAGELMGKTPGGFYYTRAFVCDVSESRGDIPAEEELAAQLAEPLFEILVKITLSERLSEKPLETLKLFALNKLAVSAINSVESEIVRFPELPERPNGGKWLAICTIMGAADPKYSCSGPAYSQRAGNGGGFVADFQSVFGDTHWAYGSFAHPLRLWDARDFYLDLASGRTPDQYALVDVPDFERLHIVRRTDEGLELDIPVLTKDEYERLNADCANAAAEFAKILAEPLKKLIEARKFDVPRTVDEREYFVHYGAARILPLALMLKAVGTGFVKAEIGKTPIIVAVL